MSITKEEYNEMMKASKYTILLEVINPENGIYVYKVGNNKLYCLDNVGRFMPCYEPEELELDLIEIYDP